MRLFTSHLSFSPWRSWVRALPWPKDSFKIPKFQSHRGYHRGGLRENTLEALAEAASRGAQMCEFDVQLTQEKIPILFHDWDLRNITGESITPSQLTLRELRQRLPITTLEEVFTTSTVMPDFFNIELKTLSIDGLLTQRVARVLREQRACQRILLSSFNPIALFFAESFLPKVPRALLITSTWDASDSWFRRQNLFVGASSIHMLNLDYAMMSADEIAHWQKRDIPLSIWTVNDLSQAQRLLAQGAESIITDLDPHLFSKSNQTKS